MTTTDSWLPLAEYSIKHHVSISTLRRRIKGEDIKFRLDNGKYFILDESKTADYVEQHRPSLKNEVIHSTDAATDSGPGHEAGESVISAANRLLSDLKKAYTQVLQEKEEQILTLREENVDLKTLIRVLEAENARLHERQ